MKASGAGSAGEARANIVLGFARAPDGGRLPVTASVDAIVRHGAVIGASGGGKTAWTQGVIVQLLRANPRLPVILVDPKNDLAQGLTLFLSALAGSLPPASQKALSDGFRLVAPFRDPSLELNLLAREEGVEPELQALAVMDALQSALDDDLAGFARIASALQVSLTAGIEVGLNSPSCRSCCSMRTSGEASRRDSRKAARERCWRRGSERPRPRPSLLSSLGSTACSPRSSRAGSCRPTVASPSATGSTRASRSSTSAALPMGCARSRSSSGAGSCSGCRRRCFRAP